MSVPKIIQDVRNLSTSLSQEVKDRKSLGDTVQGVSEKVDETEVSLATLNQNLRRGLVLSSITDVRVGEVVYLMESGTPVAFTVVDKDYQTYSSDAQNYILLRHGLLPAKSYEDTDESVLNYSESSLDTYLSSTYKSWLANSPGIVFQSTRISLHYYDTNARETYVNREIFAPSLTELTGRSIKVVTDRREGTLFSHFNNNDSIILDSVDSPLSYYTRSLYRESAEDTVGKAYCWNSAGTLQYSDINSPQYLKPCVSLHYDSLVYRKIPFTGNTLATASLV